VSKGTTSYLTDDDDDDDDGDDDKTPTQAATRSAALPTNKSVAVVIVSATSRLWILYVDGDAAAVQRLTP